MGQSKATQVAAQDWTNINAQHDTQSQAEDERPPQIPVPVKLDEDEHVGFKEMPNLRTSRPALRRG